MGTEKFNYIRPSVANGDNVVLLHQAWGDPVTAKSPAESVGDNIQRAGLFSTAPYRPADHPSRRPVERKPGREGHCTALDDTCNAWATNKYPGLCNFHGRKHQGLSARPY